LTEGGASRAVMLCSIESMHNGDEGEILSWSSRVEEQINLDLGWNYKNGR
jgi:hypothetical protein